MSATVAESNGCTTAFDVTVNNSTAPVVGPWIVFGDGEVDAVGTVISTDGTLRGTWKFEASCGLIEGASPTNTRVYGADPADVTNQFNPSIAPVTTDGYNSQFVALGRLACAAAFRVTFTPTSGSGGVRQHVTRAA